MTASVSFKRCITASAISPARCRIGEPVEFDISDVPGMQLELFEGAFLQLVGAPELLLESSLPRSQRRGCSRFRRVRRPGARWSLRRDGMRQAWLMTKMKRASAAIATDPAHHDRTRPERLFFESAERGKPCGRLPGCVVVCAVV